MRRAFFRSFSIVLLSLITIILFVNASGEISCSFISGNTCPSGARLIGVENYTGGYNNAHAQNSSLDTYAYSLCCNSTNATITISRDCHGDFSVINLFNINNSHVEIGSNSNYSYPACLSSDWKKVSCYFPTGSCEAGYSCVMSMAGSEGANSSNAHVGDCSYYNQKVCCKLGNTAPSAPTLYYPANGNDSVFERKPNFNWSQSTDPDGDAITYTLNASCGGCSAACYQPLITSITTTNYTITSALCVDRVYNWTVSACDVYGDCNSSTIFNFTVKSVVGLELVVNATSFGAMANNQNDDTTDNNPNPLVARNTGNVLLNVSLNATSLFTSIALNTHYYQFKAGENKSDSYVIGCSQHASFNNMSSSPKTIFCNMSYENISDQAALHLNITIPPAEGAGVKSSVIEVTYTSVEN